MYMFIIVLILWWFGHSWFITIYNMFNNRPVTYLMKRYMTIIIISITKRFWNYGGQRIFIQMTCFRCFRNGKGGFIVASPKVQKFLAFVGFVVVFFLLFLLIFVFLCFVFVFWCFFWIWLVLQCIYTCTVSFKKNNVYV